MKGGNYDEKKNDKFAINNDIHGGDTGRMLDGFGHNSEGP